MSDFYENIEKANKLDLPTSINRTNKVPLDITSIFENKTALENYVKSNTVAYPGQIVAYMGNSDEDFLQHICIINSTGSDGTGYTDITTRVNELYAELRATSTVSYSANDDSYSDQTWSLITTSGDDSSICTKYLSSVAQINSYIVLPIYIDLNQIKPQAHRVIVQRSDSLSGPWSDYQETSLFGGSNSIVLKDKVTSYGNAYYRITCTMANGTLSKSKHKSDSDIDQAIYYLVRMGSHNIADANGNLKALNSVLHSPDSQIFNDNLNKIVLSTNSPETARRCIMYTISENSETPAIQGYAIGDSLAYGYKINNVGWYCQHVDASQISNGVYQNTIISIADKLSDFYKNCCSKNLTVTAGATKQLYLHMFMITFTGESIDGLVIGDNISNVLKFTFYIANTNALICTFIDNFLANKTYISSEILQSSIRVLSNMPEYQALDAVQLSVKTLILKSTDPISGELEEETASERNIEIQNSIQNSKYRVLDISTEKKYTSNVGQLIQISYIDNFQTSYFDDYSEYLKTSGDGKKYYHFVQEINISSNANPNNIRTFYSSIGKCEILNIAEQYTQDSDNMIFDFTPALGMSKIVRNDDNGIWLDTSSNSNNELKINTPYVVIRSDNTYQNVSDVIHNNIIDIPKINTNSSPTVYRYGLKIRNKERVYIKYYDGTVYRNYNFLNKVGSKVAADIRKISDDPSNGINADMSFEFFIKTHGDTNPFKKIGSLTGNLGAGNNFNIDIYRDKINIKIPTMNNNITLDISSDEYNHVVIVIKYNIINISTKDSEVFKTFDMQQYRTINVYLNGVMSKSVEFDQGTTGAVKKILSLELTDKQYNDYVSASIGDGSYAKLLGENFYSEGDNNVFAINNESDDTSIDIGAIRVYSLALTHEEVFKNYTSCLSYDERVAYESLKNTNILKILFMSHNKPGDTQNFGNGVLYYKTKGEAIAQQSTSKSGKTLYGNNNIASLNQIKNKKDSKSSYVSSKMVLLNNGTVTTYEDCDLYLQGTSSLAYPVKNYKIKLFSNTANGNSGIISKEVTDEKGQKTYMYAISSENDRSKNKIDLPGLGIQYNDLAKDNVYTLKCDYMEHSHRNNTPTADFYHDVLLPNIIGDSVEKYSPAIKVPASDGTLGKKYRDSITGIPCVVYYTDTYQENEITSATAFTSAIGQATYLGTYMFNVDKEGAALGFEIKPKEFIEGDGSDIQIDASIAKTIDTAMEIIYNDSPVLLLNGNGSINSETLRIIKSDSNIKYNKPYTYTEYYYDGVRKRIQSSEANGIMNNIKVLPCISYEGGTNDNSSAAAFIPFEYKYYIFVKDKWNNAYPNSQNNKVICISRHELSNNSYEAKVKIGGAFNENFVNADNVISKIKQKDDPRQTYNTELRVPHIFSSDSNLYKANDEEYATINICIEEKDGNVYIYDTSTNTSNANRFTHYNGGNFTNVIAIRKSYSNDQNGFNQFYKDILDIQMSYVESEYLGETFERKIQIRAQDYRGKWQNSDIDIEIFENHYKIFDNSQHKIKYDGSNTTSIFNKIWLDPKDFITSTNKPCDNISDSGDASIEIYFDKITEILLGDMSSGRLTPAAMFRKLQYMNTTLETRFNYVTENDEYITIDLLEMFTDGKSNNTLDNINNLSKLYSLAYKRLDETINWVYNSAASPNNSECTFAKEFSNYFSKNYCLAYFLQMLVFTQVDNAGKNAMFDTWGDNVLYPRPYDMDSQMGLNNSGVDDIPSYAELNVDLSPQKITESLIDVGFTGQFNNTVPLWASTSSAIHERFTKYNTSQNFLWKKFATVFADEIAELYFSLRDNIYSVDRVMAAIDSKTFNKIHPEFYNNDVYKKYISYTETDEKTGTIVSSKYLQCVAGDRRIRYRKFYSDRLSFLDTYFAAKSGKETNKYSAINIRSNASNSIDLVFKVSRPIYIDIQGDSGKNQHIITLCLPSDTYTQGSVTREGTLIKVKVFGSDKNIDIYGAEYISEIYNIQSLNLNKLYVQNCVELTSLNISGSDSLVDLSLGDYRYIKDIDISGCSKINGTLSLVNSPNIESLNISNTGISEVLLPTTENNLKRFIARNNTSLSTISFQNSPITTDIDLTGSTNIENISFINCNNITDFDFKRHSNLHQITVQNCKSMMNVDLSFLQNLSNITIQNCTNLKKIKLQDVTIAGNGSETNLDFSTNTNLTVINTMGIVSQNKSNKIILKLPLVSDTRSDHILINLSSTQGRANMISQVYTNNTNINDRRDGIYDFTGINRIEGIHFGSNAKVRHIKNLTCKYPRESIYEAMRDAGIEYAYASPMYNLFAWTYLETFTNCEFSYSSRVTSLSHMFHETNKLCNIPERIYCYDFITDIGVDEIAEYPEDTTVNKTAEYSEECYYYSNDSDSGSAEDYIQYKNIIHNYRGYSENDASTKYCYYNPYITHVGHIAYDCGAGYALKDEYYGKLLGHPVLDMLGSRIRQTITTTVTDARGHTSNTSTQKYINNFSKLQDFQYAFYSGIDRQYVDNNGNSTYFEGSDQRTARGIKIPENFFINICKDSGENNIQFIGCFGSCGRIKEVSSILPSNTIYTSYMFYNDPYISNVNSNIFKKCYFKLQDTIGMFQNDYDIVDILPDKLNGTFDTDNEGNKIAVNSVGIDNFLPKTLTNTLGMFSGCYMIKPIVKRISVTINQSDSSRNNCDCDEIIDTCVYTMSVNDNEITIDITSGSIQELNFKIYIEDITVTHPIPKIIYNDGSTLCLNKTIRIVAEVTNDICVNIDVPIRFALSTLLGGCTGLKNTSYMFFNSNISEYLYLDEGCLAGYDSLKYIDGMFASTGESVNELIYAYNYADNINTANGFKKELITYLPFNGKKHLTPIYLPEKIFKKDTGETAESIYSAIGLFSGRKEVCGKLSRKVLGNDYKYCILLDANDVENTYYSETTYISSDFFEGIQDLVNIGGAYMPSNEDIKTLYGDEYFGQYNHSIGISTYCRSLTGFFGNTSISAVSKNIFKHIARNGVKIDASQMFFRGVMDTTVSNQQSAYVYKPLYNDSSNTFLSSGVIFVNDPAENTYSNVRKGNQKPDDELIQSIYLSGASINTGLVEGDDISVIPLTISENLSLYPIFSPDNVSTTYISLSQIFAGQRNIIWNINSMNNTTRTDVNMLSNISIYNINDAFRYNKIYMIPHDIFKGQTNLETISNVFYGQNCMQLVNLSCIVDKIGKGNVAKAEFTNTSITSPLNKFTVYNTSNIVISMIQMNEYNSGISKDIFEGCTSLKNCQASFMGSSITLFRSDDTILYVTPIGDDKVENIISFINDDNTNIIEVDSNNAGSIRTAVYPELSREIFKDCRGTLEDTSYMFAMCENMRGIIGIGNVKINDRSKYEQVFDDKLRTYFNSLYNIINTDANYKIACEKTEISEILNAIRKVAYSEISQHTINKLSTLLTNINNKSRNDLGESYYTIVYILKKMLNDTKWSADSENFDVQYQRIIPIVQDAQNNTMTNASVPSSIRNNLIPVSDAKIVIKELSSETMVFGNWMIDDNIFQFSNEFEEICIDSGRYISVQNENFLTNIQNSGYIFIDDYSKLIASIIFIYQNWNNEDIGIFRELRKFIKYIVNGALKFRASGDESSITTHYRNIICNDDENNILYKSFKDNTTTMFTKISQYNRYRIGQQNYSTYDSNSIKWGLLSNCTNLKNTSYMFAECVGLYGSIPCDIFSSNQEYDQLKSIRGMFQGCQGLGMAQPFIDGESLSDALPFAYTSDFTFKNIFSTTRQLIIKDDATGTSTTTENVYLSDECSINTSCEYIYPTNIIKAYRPEDFESSSSYDYKWYDGSQYDDINKHITRYNAPVTKYFIPKDWADKLTIVSDISYLFYGVGLPTYSFKKSAQLYKEQGLINDLPKFLTIDPSEFKSADKYTKCAKTIISTKYDDSKLYNFYKVENKVTSLEINTNTTFRMGELSLSDASFNKCSKIKYANSAFESNYAILNATITNTFLNSAVYLDDGSISNISKIFKYSMVSDIDGFMLNGSTTLRTVSEAFYGIRLCVFGRDQYINDVNLNRMSIFRVNETFKHIPLFGYTINETYGNVIRQSQVYGVSFNGVTPKTSSIYMYTFTDNNNFINIISADQVTSDDIYNLNTNNMMPSRYTYGQYKNQFILTVHPDVDNSDYKRQAILNIRNITVQSNYRNTV